MSYEVQPQRTQLYHLLTVGEDSMLVLAENESAVGDFRLSLISPQRSRRFLPGLDCVQLFVDQKASCRTSFQYLTPIEQCFDSARIENLHWCATVQHYAATHKDIFETKSGVSLLHREKRTRSIFSADEDSMRIALSGVRTRHPFRWGKRRIHQIPFVVNNNRADVKTTVAILRDRRPPINTVAGSRAS
ncbi:hypothetical protein TNCV_4800001 [Trichonephila clavipes]|uniref:Uncharacterized protein n=1 Tax=Trichonephila clavipes TaxID=2585209 RepID=A0A8X6V0J7_TRICX|nr:hypothetical protein TNCV_4800001 [Trichonephila clavipes]